MQMNTRSRRGLYSAREELWSSCRLCPRIQGCTVQPAFFHCFKILREQLVTRREPLPVCEGTQIYTYTRVLPQYVARNWGMPAHELLTLPAPPGKRFHPPDSLRENSSDVAADGYRCWSAGFFLDPPSGTIQIPSAGFVIFSL